MEDAMHRRGGPAEARAARPPDGSEPFDASHRLTGMARADSDTQDPGAGGVGDSVPHDGSAAQAPYSDAAATADAPAERGFFGRIMDAIVPSEVPAPVARGSAPAGSVRGLVNLRRMRVEDVAMPTVEITAVPVDISMDALVAVFREHGVTRIPVYRDTLDHPLGLIHLKDFALKHGFDSDAAFDLPALLRPLIYAPPSMPASVLLQKMQTDRMHMALVIDEYGGVDGLVTIEDLIEQVVGEIEDEHDTDDDKFWTVEKPGVYLAQSRTPLDAFEAEIGTTLAPDADEEIDTLGGLVFTLVGRVPVRGEVIDHPAGPQFEIVDADPRRIKRLRVRTVGVAGMPQPTSVARTEGEGPPADPR